MDNKLLFAAGAVGLLGVYFAFGSGPKTRALPPGTSTGGYTNTSGVTQYVNDAGQIVNAAGQIIAALTKPGTPSGTTTTGAPTYAVDGYDSSGNAINSNGYQLNADGTLKTDGSGNYVLGVDVAGPAQDNTLSAGNDNGDGMPDSQV